MPIQKSDIHFILVRTRFASNLGSAARAMKNMGFERLILVQPECEVGIEARAYAMKGADILDRALFLPDMEAVTHQVGTLIGATGRFRQARPSLVDCRTLAGELAGKFATSSIGMVFGCEENGLSHEELRQCHWLLRIPTDSDYPVMNLAQAVAVVAYELNVTMAARPAGRVLHEADADENRRFLEFLEETLRQADLPADVDLSRLMRRIRRIAVRARLEKEDINLLRGLLAGFTPKRRRE
jgi:tRNA (cytidine32/uridine32-2'-O)-methyltransferase